MFFLVSNSQPAYSSQTVLGGAHPTTVKMQRVGQPGTVVERPNLPTTSESASPGDVGLTKIAAEWSRCTRTMFFFLGLEIQKSIIEIIWL